MAWQLKIQTARVDLSPTSDESMRARTHASYRPDPSAKRLIDALTNLQLPRI